MQRTVLVTGATGTVGSRLTRSLTETPGVLVRAFVRSPEKSQALGALGVDLRTGSFEDAASLDRAMTGVDTLALITAANERAGEQATAAIASARRVGVHKIVRLSAVRAAEDGPTDNTRQHARSERELRESGLAFVVLRPQFFMDNLLGSAAAVVGEGKLHSGVGEGAIGMIDARDVADCLVQAVLRSEFDGRTLELTGPQSISHRVVAAALAEAIRRPVEYAPLTPEAAAEPLRALGAGPWLVQLMTDYMRAYRGGLGDFVSDVVRSMTGRDARSIETFAREVFAPAAGRLAEVSQ